jgi:hypothetical protein
MRLFRGEDTRFRKPTDTFAAPITAALSRIRAGLVEAARSGLCFDLFTFTTSCL